MSAIRKTLKLLCDSLCDCSLTKMFQKSPTFQNQTFEISRQKYLYEQSQCDPKQFERFFNIYYPRNHQEEMFALMIRHDQNFRSLAFLRRPKIQSCMKMRTMPCSR